MYENAGNRLTEPNRGRERIVARIPQTPSSARFPPFFFALALLPPEEQIRQEIVSHDQEEAEEKRGDFIYVGHGLTIVQQHFS